MPNLDKKNSKQISIWGEKLTGELTICEYYEVENKSRCGRLASSKHRENRNYCKIHHELVNKINKERQQEFIKELKNNINNYFFFPDTFIIRNFTKKDVQIFLDRLNNGDFD